MRKIDEQMAEAFSYRAPFKSGNSEVKVTKLPDGRFTAEAYLHGNRIAFIDETDGFKPKVDMQTLKTWPSNTTLNRLRALGFDVRKPRGKLLLDGKEV